MELYDVMRTTFAAREFTGDPLPDEVLVTILDHARFAPSGGNRQGWRVIVVRDRASKEQLAALSGLAAKRYAAQVQAGENPWNTIDPTSVSAATIERTPAPARLTDSSATGSRGPGRLRGSQGRRLDGPGPWARRDCQRGLCLPLRVEHPARRAPGRVRGSITTLAVAQEPKLQELLGLPPHVAVAAVMPLGRPVRLLTKLKRKNVAEFAVRERWGGSPLAP